jgi:hypothetical protein
VKVASEPAALLKVLGNPTYRFKRIGLEAGPLSQWLFSALAEAELPVICVEWPIREADIVRLLRHVRKVPVSEVELARGNTSTMAWSMWPADRPAHTMRE